MRPLATALAALALLGCAIPEVPCEALAAEIAACDLQPARLRCDRLEPEELARLYSLVADDGCDALRDPSTGAIDRRACEALAWDCPGAIGPTPSYAPTVHPVLFVSGIDARPAFGWSEELLERVAATTGATVVHARLPGWSTVDVRALALDGEIASAALATGRVHLICYAVAGIDCRFAISPRGLWREDPEAQRAAAARVASVTTIATPHRGTEVATAVLELATDARAGNAIRTLLGGGAAHALDDRQLDAVLGALTLDGARALNREVIDAPDVLYQSWAGLSFVLGESWIESEDAIRRACDDPAVAPIAEREAERRDAMSEPLWATAPYAGRSGGESGTASLGPGDGMVAVASARWGTFRGCLPADHYDVIGQFDDRGPDPRTGFEADRFYAAVIRELAERGL
jgi:triacylglycerol lipase